MDTERLKKIDVFSSLPDDELAKLARQAQETTVDEGTVLIEAGGSSEKLWGIEDGTVEVERDGETVATLGAGDVVGETGILKRKLRNASVKATSDVKGFVIAQSDIKRLRKQDPDLDEALQKVLEERSDD